jgi:sterol desaturase/sphingolipid hydroxylase (fatty acid hydroxylase superfamily)
MERTSIIRLLIFIFFVTTFAVAEQIWPRRERHVSTWKRRWQNLLMITIGSALTILIPAGAALGVAEIARVNGWGLFRWTGLPIWLNGIISLFVLDFIIYLHHVAFHRFHILWRVHRVHHTDRDIDTTSGVRFHPVEIVASMFVKMAAIASFGIAPWAYLVFEIILNGCSLFNHANLRLPLKADRVLRRLLVTPDMHRVHHSVFHDENNRNFGFCLSWWDFGCRTYRDQPRSGHVNMRIGLPQTQDNRPLKFLWLLALPFRNEKT